RRGRAALRPSQKEDHSLQVARTGNDSLFGRSPTQSVCRRGGASRQPAWRYRGLSPPRQRRRSLLRLQEDANAPAALARERPRVDLTSEAWLTHPASREHTGVLDNQTMRRWHYQGLGRPSRGSDWLARLVLGPETPSEVARLQQAALAPPLR